MIAEFEARGISYVQVPLDVAELQQYCEEQGIPNDPAARCEFEGVKHERIKSLFSEPTKTPIKDFMARQN